MSDLAVEVSGLRLSYGDVNALEDVSFELKRGRLVGVIGPNGAGKSTLIKALVGAKRPDRGEVRILGKSVKKKLESVTYVPQRGAVDWDFPITAEQVVRQGRYQSMGLLGRFGDAEKEVVREAMESVGITDLGRRQIGALSGGQQQRVFLARALAQGGELFLLDEPFAGVDAATESAIVDVLRGLREKGKTVIVVHHDLMTARDYFDDLLLLNRRVIATGAVEEVFTAENLRETYGGRVAVFFEPGKSNQEEDRAG